MADDDLVELSQDDWDTLDVLLDKVWAVTNRDLSTPNMAVPTQTFVRAGEKAGFKSRQVRDRLSSHPEFHKLRFNAGDRQTAVHSYFKGDPDSPPSKYAPRRPRKVRLVTGGPLREIYPDKRYRFDKKQWWGFELIRAYDAGELA